jgi:hypothetical protein
MAVGTCRPDFTQNGAFTMSIFLRITPKCFMVVMTLAQVALIGALIACCFA